jgi:propionyl-CoA carboxylase alpha chain
MASSRIIQRVLIANRGEIARRIIRTCSKLGIQTVAVYSDVDAHAPFVHEATYAEPIGGAQSYLSIDAIIKAAQRSAADAIHPGYGFLSENAEFAEAVRAAGLVFLGPTPETIRSLGSKTNAKLLASKAQAPVSPTLLLTQPSLDAQVDAIKQFGHDSGYPLILKAAAGGGGRGMRLIDANTDIRAELASARRESEKAFRSDEIFIEKYIAPARHVEVQIIGDQSGNAAALGTRDCSLQRSNQKIIEEAPASGLKLGVVEAICDAAVRLAREANYSSLGTVEFLYGPDGRFYFLEVNTRLQVEHPVTEMVTGLDLIELQIRIAEGRTLPELGLTHTPPPRGHAIEARLCAEEYTGSFITTTGVILDLSIPTHQAGIRADMGIEVCSEVSHNYDSLLGKIIAHAPTRHEAIELLDQALIQTRISGVGTNRALLLHLLKHCDFRALKHSVQGTKELLPSSEELERARIEAHAIAAALRTQLPLSAWAQNSPWFSAEPRRLSAIAVPYATRIQGETIRSSSLQCSEHLRVHVTTPQEAVFDIHVQHLAEISPFHLRASLDLGTDRAVEVSLLIDGPSLWLHLPAATFELLELHKLPSISAGEGPGGGTVVTSSIPGRVAALQCKEGDVVNAGATLMVLDSMKMEHPIRAPSDGTVSKLPVSVGTVVQAGAVLAVIKG